MRLNAINPSDNPMEELLFCFGGDGDSGSDSGGSDSGGSSRGTTTSSRGSSGGTRGRSSGNDSSRDSLGDSSISSGYGGYDGGGGDGNDNRSTPAPNFAPPSFSPTTISRDDAAIAAAQDRSRSQLGLGGGDGGGGSPVATPVATAPVATAPVTPTFAPNLVNQPLTVGGAFVAPYDSFQRSPQQMFGYGGLTAAPYSPDAISFQGGAPAASFSPLGAPAISQFDMGRAPTPAGVPDDRSFFDRVGENLGNMFNRQEQRAGVFNPATGTFQTFDGQTTLAKTSDNMLADFAVNALNPFSGLTGFVDTKTYQPLAGGENLQYSNFSGGLLSGMIGENLVPFSELEAGSAQMSDGGGSDQPFIIPSEVAQTDPETGEPTAFPTFAPRRFEYQPYVGQFYTIPSRFTRPVSLLG